MAIRKMAPAVSGTTTQPKIYALGERILKKGMKGEDV